MRYRDDQDEADEFLGRGQLQRHTFKGNFVWDLPDIEGSGSIAKHVLAAVANDWQLSGIYTGQSGDRYTIGYGYQSGGGNVNITGSPNYGGRVIINGDPGSGCSDNQYQQFNTAVFSGPAVGSVGLESGQNYLTGCFETLHGPRDRAELPPGRQPHGPTPPRDVQRVQHGRLLRVGTRRSTSRVRPIRR